MSGGTTFSIITATLNRRELLAGAIASVREARRQNPNLEIEHLIVDGGSTDGTLEWLVGEPDLLVLSGPDAGIYDAWNKGVAASTGKVIGFLNSDDLFASEPFAKISMAFDDPECQMVTGRADVSDLDSRQPARLLPIIDPPVSATNALLGIPLINARFFRREIFAKTGGFDPRWKFLGDCDFMLRVALAGIGSASLPDVLYHYQRHAGSLTFDRAASRAAMVHDEYLDWTELWLAREITGDLQKILRRSHSRRAWARLARAGDWNAARQAIRRGFAYNSVWPLSAFDYLWATLRS